MLISPFTNETQITWTVPVDDDYLNTFLSDSTQFYVKMTDLNGGNEQDSSVFTITALRSSQNSAFTKSGAFIAIIVVAAISCLVFCCVVVFQVCKVGCIQKNPVGAT
jgi:hypothetical protein